MPNTMIPRRRSQNQRLGFTTAQQVIYRPLVEAAWSAFCRQTQTDPKDKPARRVWYELHLVAATGQTTTTECNRRNHFEEAMREFEAVAGESIYWQRRADEGDMRRARHGLQEFCREHDVEDSYIAGMARQMFDCADLERLKPRQLRDILIALKLHLRRHDRPIL